MTSIRQADGTDTSKLYDLIDVLGFHKSEGYFERCLDEQDAGNRLIFIICDDDGKEAGYAMLNWHPRYSLFKKLGMPEIQDLNIIPDKRQNGLATALIKHCESIALNKNCDFMGIGVGLYKDYGAAQRLYTKLGYIPDGNGVTYDRSTVAAGTYHPVDDDLCLMMVKNLQK